MAKKEISILLKARNAMAAGIASAYKSLQGFGRSAVNIAKWFTRGFMVAGSAVAGFVAKSVSSYAESEKATRALSSALTAYGENATAIIPKLNAVANAILDETGASDDATIATMARLKMAGIETAQLESAAKAVVALKSKNIEGAAAERMVAAALAGNYAAFSRHIPQLKNATTEAEKAALVSRFLTAGYDAQKDSLGTVSGAWGLLTERVGNAWEAIGEAISNNTDLSDWLKNAADRVKELTDRFTEFAASDSMVAAVSGIKTFANEAAFNFARVALAGKITWASVVDALETAGNYIGNLLGAYINVWKQDLAFLADYAVAIWNKIKSPGSKFDPPNTAAVKAAYSELARAAVDSEGVVNKRSKAAYAELDKLREEHANRTAEIAKETADGLVAAEQRRVKAAKNANTEIEGAAKSHAQNMKDIISQGVADGASEDLKRAKEAESAAKDQAEKSSEAASKARELFFSRDARKEAKEKAKADAKEARQMEQALAKGRKGLRGAGITRAQQAEAAAIKAAEDAERAKFAEQDRIAYEAHLQEAMDAIKSNTANIATNTEDLDSKLDEISMPA